MNCGTCSIGKTCLNGRCVVSGSGVNNGGGASSPTVATGKEEIKTVALMARAEISAKIEEIKKLIAQLIQQLIIELQKQRQ